jgi:hypothetical protein
MRYTEAQKRKILAKVNSAPPGKYMEAVKKSGVSYAAIRKWEGPTPPDKRADRYEKKDKRAESKKISKGPIAELFDIRNRLNLILKKL